MSTSAVNGEDAVGFYAAALRDTFGPTPVGALGVDVGEGLLTPGRYLVQIWNLTPGAVCWIVQQGGEEADPTAIAAGPGRRRFPLGPVFVALETQARTGADDRLFAICSAGATCEVVVSRVSEGNGS